MSWLVVRASAAASPSLPVIVTIDGQPCLLLRTAVVPIWRCALRRGKNFHHLFQCMSVLLMENTQLRAGIVGFLVNFIKNGKKKSKS